MEKWAKQQNAQKEGSFKKPLPVTNAFKKPSAADAGFKVLTKVVIKAAWWIQLEVIFYFGFLHYFSLKNQKLI